MDVREGEYLTHLLDTLAELRKREHGVEVLFLEASEEALVRRYRETRRRHPLAPDGNVVDGIRAERKALSTMREVADRIVDTSALTVHQLKDLLIETYVAPGHRPGLAISLVSFGFKHGVPFDADLVFDVRFLPNPHFVEGLRPLDGRDDPVGAGPADRAGQEPELADDRGHPPAPQPALAGHDGLVDPGALLGGDQLGGVLLGDAAAHRALVPRRPRALVEDEVDEVACGGARHGGEPIGSRPLSRRGPAAS